MSEPTGDVVPLFPPVDDEAAIVEQERSYCRHQRTTLDTASRRVHCRDCGREVDPFDTLLRFARDYKRHQQQVGSLARQERLLAARVEGLKREERNAKARLRRAAER